jgi:hypothetical protein
MALDFGVLQGMDPAGAFFRGQEAVRAEQERNALRQMQAEQMAMQRENMLAQRQRQQFEMEQTLEDRRRRAEQEGQFRQLADLVRQHGLDPDDPKVLGQFAQAALMSGQPQLAQFVTSMSERAAKRRDAAAEAARIGAILGPQAQPSAPQNAFAAPAVNAFAAPRPELLAGTPYSVGLASTPAPAPAAAAPANAPKIAELERQRDALEALGTPAALAQAKRLDRQLEKLQPKEVALSADMQGYKLAKSEGFKGTFFDYKRQLAEAGRAPVQPKEPPAPIPVVDPATGQVKYVPREQAVGMTPPTFMESLTPKERQVREAKFPQATSALKAFDNTATTLIKDLETLANHPGLPSITGIAAGRLPGLTAQGREAQALYDKIMARGGFQELQNMRQASPTGGALGNVSNAEGERLQAAFAALDRRQDAPSVRKAIRDAITQTQTSKQNLREAYDLTYEYKQRGGAAPAAAPATPNIDALLNKYK